MAGSRKGIPNKPKRRLLQLLNERYPGYHPVLELAEIANAKDANGEFIHDAQMRYNANRDLMPYVEPKMVAVEADHKGDINVHVTKRVIKSGGN